MIGAFFLFVSIPSVSLWALFGTAIGRLLATGRALRIFNLLMAALLVVSLIPLFL